MPRKLKLDSLKAELNAVETLLQEAIENGDPVGELQFGQRREMLAQKINELEKNVQTTANVALYFGGKPVLGSRGITADFAGNVLEEFQDLISKLFASNEYGDLGKRGKIPMKDNTQLMITEIAKGSFGFILEELSDQYELAETSLKQIVNEVSKIIYKSSQEDESEFEQLLEKLDGRTFLSLRDFFINLDNSEATLRLVEDINEYNLGSIEIHRARIRTESAKIDEESIEIVGTLVGFLPEHRKFELKIEDKEVIYGTTTKEVAEEFTKLISKGESIINVKWRVNCISRTISPINRKPRTAYTLLEFIARIDDET